MAMKRKAIDDVDPEILEQRHFQHVIDTFLFYRTYSLRQVERKTKCFQSIPLHHQAMVPTLGKRLKNMQNAIESNYKFIKDIIKATERMFVNSNVSEGRNEVNRTPISGDDLDRVRTTLKQFVRDWSKEGKQERDQCYGTIYKELDNLFPIDSCNRENISVLIPGAGLGRLMFDIASQGFTCQGNEFSLYMLFASNYILNVCTQSECISLYPWVHNACNVVGNNDQLREIKIPDVTPHLTSNFGFSMAAGDFLDIYTELNTWDCVVMCFFIDTAHNIIEYIEKVYNILKPGGYFINFGPLLYHFANVLHEPSIELTYQEIKDVLLSKFRFNLITERIGIRSTYIENSRSMMKMQYDSVFYVVQKPFL